MSSMGYVQGFVAPIRTADRSAYIDFANRTDALFHEMGAARVVDGIGDDIQRGKTNDFYTAVNAAEGETVGFGWMEFADKAARDAVMERMRSDPRMADLGDMPFDGKRMIFGGFETLMDEGAGGGGYFDGFIVAVPTANRQAYLESAQKAWPVFRNHGVLRHVECWGEDVPRGEVTDYYRAVFAKDDETVVISWFEWPDKATRDKGSAAAMEDERLKGMMDSPPFDGARMIYGGFEVVSDF